MYAAPLAISFVPRYCLSIEQSSQYTAMRDALVILLSTSSDNIRYIKRRAVSIASLLSGDTRKNYLVDSLTD